MSTDFIKIFNRNSKEYQKIRAVAEILTLYNDVGAFFCVDDTFFDFGENLKWTTIVGGKPYSNDGQYQLLYPGQLEIIINGTFYDVSNVIFDLLNNINKRGW